LKDEYGIEPAAATVVLYQVLVTLLKKFKQNAVVLKEAGVLN
jgi:hypothetical protein